jgi:hypothetical protein
MTVRIEIGATSAGGPASLDLEELLATRLLVQGNSGSGKSHPLRRLLEQSAPWVQQAVIDPEGDFRTLGDRFGHLAIDAAASGLAGLKRAAEGVRQHRVPVVRNLENLEVDNQLRHAAAFLDGLFRGGGGARRVVADAGRGGRGAALRAGDGRRCLGRGAAHLARRHDRPDVPRAQARAFRGAGPGDLPPAAAGQDRRGVYLLLARAALAGAGEVRRATRTTRWPGRREAAG